MRFVLRHVVSTPAPAAGRWSGFAKSPRRPRRRPRRSPRMRQGVRRCGISSILWIQSIPSGAVAPPPVHLDSPRPTSTHLDPPRPRCPGDPRARRRAGATRGVARRGRERVEGEVVRPELAAPFAFARRARERMMPAHEVDLPRHVMPCVPCANVSPKGRLGRADRASAVRFASSCALGTLFCSGRHGSVEEASSRVIRWRATLRRAARLFSL